MAKLISEMTAQQAGEVCCGEMMRRGYSPSHLMVLGVGDKVQIVLDVIANPDGWGWSKGFILDWGEIDPDLLQRDFEVWKASMRQRMNGGDPPPIVKEAVRRFGALAVEDALAARVGLG